jgi:hypothetical protein
MPTWAIHASSVRDELKNAANVRPMIEERDRAIEQKTKDLYDAKKQLTNTLAKADVFQNQLKLLQSKADEMNATRDVSPPFPTTTHSLRYLFSFLFFFFFFLCRNIC